MLYLVSTGEKIINQCSMAMSLLLKYIMLISKQILKITSFMNDKTQGINQDSRFDGVAAMV